VAKHDLDDDHAQAGRPGTGTLGRPETALLTMATRRISANGFVDPCIPTLASTPPTAPGWVHETEDGSTISRL
jgi:hypothetical protein